jgi:hypothetical protein
MTRIMIHPYTMVSAICASYMAVFISCLVPINSTFVMHMDLCRMWVR